MKKDLLAFVFKLSAYTLFMSFIYFFTKKLIPEKFYFEKTPYLILFFFIVTLVFHAGLLNSAKKNYRSMVTFYMMATALKLFLFLGIIIGYGLLKTGKSVAFISNFFVLYVLFTVFEVTLVYFQFRTKVPVGEENPKEQG
ncbi:MAG: hypothetical protein ABI855_00425 [Bacteroidota bacterium]